MKDVKLVGSWPSTITVAPCQAGPIQNFRPYWAITLRPVARSGTARDGPGPYRAKVQARGPARHDHMGYASGPQGPRQFWQFALGLGVNSS